MNHRKKLITIGVTIAASLAAPSAAQAGSNPLTPDVFGNGGGDPTPLTATCQRQPVHIPFGRHWLAAKPGVISAFTIVDTELKCVTFHEMRIVKCWTKHPMPVVTEKTDHGAGKPGDETGLGALRAYMWNVATCQLNAAGLDTGTLQ